MGLPFCILILSATAVSERASFFLFFLFVFFSFAKDCTMTKGDRESIVGANGVAWGESLKGNGVGDGGSVVFTRTHE